ncbi:hypothetical protein ACE1BS_11885 [Aeromonas jandaei]
MSEMHYIEKFAKAQLQQAVNNRMGGAQLAALVNALKAEADALTPGGGYIVSYAVKDMGLRGYCQQQGIPDGWVPATGEEVVVALVNEVELALLGHRAPGYPHDHGLPHDAIMQLVRFAADQLRSSGR